MGSCCSKETKKDQDGSSDKKRPAKTNNVHTPPPGQNQEVPAQQAPPAQPMRNELQEQLKAGLPRKVQSLKEMREDLAVRPGMFMLNNLLMAVDFFPDYTAK
jgi:hypothetical protein